MLNSNLYLLQKGWNVLHYACAGGSVEVVRWLLKNIPELQTAEALNQTSEVIMAILFFFGKKNQIFYCPFALE